MASVRASLPEKTGKPLAEWVEIARACPETAPRARQRWFKDTHGVGANYFAFIEHAFRGGTGADPREPDAMAFALWSDAAATEVFTALKAAMEELPDVVTGQRKAFTAWSRRFQFASARPVKGGCVRLGLAVAPDVDPRLEAARNEGWSERLKATRVLTSADQVDGDLRALLRSAWESS